MAPRVGNITFIAFVYGHSIHAIGVGVIKDPKLFKRLDRNMKKTGGARSSSHGRQTVRVQQSERWDEYPSMARKQPPPFPTFRPQGNRDFLFVFLAKLFDKLKKGAGNSGSYHKVHIAVLLGRQVVNGICCFFL